MSKKRAKSGAGSAGPQKWEQAIVSTPFYDEGSWNAAVVWVVGSKVEDYGHINTLAAAVNSGARRLFTHITKEDLYELVNDLGNPKNKGKVKEIPANSEICEPCRNYIDNGEEIPLPLLAKLVKFRLLDVKQKDIRRRDAEKKAPAGGGAAADKGGKGGKGGKADKERAKSPGKGSKGGKKTPEPPSPKGETKLRRRGEEDTDNKYIDDEPDDGPEHYIFVSGFHQPHLIPLLAELGIYVDAIVKVLSDDYEVLQPPPPPPDAEPPSEEKIQADEDARQKALKLRRELKTFWKETLTHLMKAPEGSKLHDLARLEYIVKTGIIPQNPEDNEQKLEFGLALFEDTACLVYDLLDARRQWQNFLTNLHLLHVPVVGGADTSHPVQDTQSQLSATPGPQAGAGAQVPAAGLAEAETSSTRPEIDLRYYKELMDTVPQESTSVPLVMHCMLEQIVAWEEDKDPPSETPRPVRVDGLEEGLLEHIVSATGKLALTNDEQMAIAADLTSSEKASDGANGAAGGNRQPHLLDHRDEMAWRLHHLRPVNGFDPLQVEQQMMLRLPLASALRLPRPSARAARERAARLQQLLHFCNNSSLTQPEIDHAFQQFVLESMEFCKIEEDGSLTQVSECQSTLPWDDPFPLISGKAEEPDMEPAPVEHSQSAAALVPAEAPVEAEQLARQLEALQPVAPSPPRPRPNSNASSRASRSRGKKKRTKSPTPRATPEPAAVNTAGETGEATKSRPGSGGILKSPSRSGSRSNLNSRRSSVHFEKGDAGAPIPQSEAAAEITATSRSLEDIMAQVVDTQKRSVDQWCFAEHFEPNVFTQVLKEASYKLPYMDSYYHKRDHTLLVALHNPYNTALHSSISWQTNLHSNVGFRNYLEHVAAAIEDWTRVEEAKYEAQRLAAEVERIQREADASASRPASGAGGAGKKGRDRSKSPKKGASRAGRSSSRGSSAERPNSSNFFVREGSLKAQKAEIDAQKAELEELERQKSEKRARSASKKEKPEETKKEKKSTSRSSSKSRASKEVLDTDAAPDAEPKEPEPQWPFMGYDVGNNMIHVGGTVTTMFPADGGQIRVNKTEFVGGTISVSTVVLKDGHQFLLHVLDPRMDPAEDDEDTAADNIQELGQQQEEGMEKADAEKTEKQAGASEKPEVGRFGSLTACFNDGMSLSFSTYGTSGAPSEAKKDLLTPAALPTPRSPSPGGMTKAESPTKSRKDKGKTATPEPAAALEEEGAAALEEEPEPEEPPISQPFQQMFVSSRDGLHVTFQLESALGVRPSSEENRCLTVRQAYPFKTSGQQACESLRRHAMEEACRIITSEGVVIRHLAEGGVTQMLYPDGKVTTLEGLPATDVGDSGGSRAASPQRAGSAKSHSGTETPTKKGRGRKSTQPLEAAATDQSEEEAAKRPAWRTTLPDGRRLANCLDGTKLDTKDALVCLATDPQTKQTLTTREDHVMKVTHPDGTLVVEHADGTRITSYTRQVPEPNTADDGQHRETGEAPQVAMKDVRFVHVECPGFATVKFDTSSTECSVEFGGGTVINSYPSGSYDIYHYDGGYLQVEEDGTAVYSPRPNNDLEVHNPDLDMRYLFRHFADTVLETVDNEANTFSVRHTGDTNVNLSPLANELVREEQETNDGQEKEAEGMQIRKVVQYKQHAPRFFVVHGDGSGTELLRYQDVAEYVAAAEDDPATAILMDQLQDYPGVVGITIMRPQARGFSHKFLKGYSQSTIIPAGLTSRDLKTLPAREYATPGPAFGTNVGQGLVVGGLVRAETTRPPVLKCPNLLEVRHLLQYKPVSQDLREGLQGGMREYAKFVLARQEESDALFVKDPRSTAERLKAAELSAAAQLLSEVNVKAVYDKATATPLAEPCPTPQPKRSRADWERDVRETEEEQENKKAIRNHEVPRYFDSELGKAFLLAQAPDIDQLTKQLAAGTLRGSPHGRSDATTTTPDNNNQDTSVNPSQQSRISDRSESNTSPEGGQQRVASTDSPYIRDLGSTPSAVRPGNPTPAHAAGQGSPAPLRPKNPTPGHSTSMAFIVDRPGAPTPKEGLGRQVPSETPSSTHAPQVYPSIPEQPQEERTSHPTRGTDRSLDGQEEKMAPLAHRTLHVTVTGDPRTQPVAVPAYIQHNGRPNAISNQRFGAVEDPVRRQVLTSSVAGACAQGAHTLSHMRGFELLPNYVDMGVLKEGNTYAFPVFLKNTGIDACRFRVKQPPPSTGLRILFRPGPVAAGMKAELTLELYAIAVGVTGESGIGKMMHNVEIVTETDHLYLPVTATVLTAHEYENRGHGAPKGSKNPGVKWVSNRPPAGQGIIRPRRDAPITN